ncbi:MAG: hypothetical protein WD989_01110 [Candidatus Paceibacterota bacterium]
MTAQTSNTISETIFRAKKSAREFIDYRNEMVIGRFAKVNKVSREEAEEIFRELMKFLYVCSYIPASSPPSAIVDEMWHTFIMFTADYFQFCVDYVGRFLHHQPTDKPYIGNRPDMLEVATEAFGPVEEKYWYHLTKTRPGQARDCDNNYCSENCQADPAISDLTKMAPYMGPPVEFQA